MTDLISVNIADHVMHVRMDRPAKKNALTAAMYDALTAALQSARQDDQVRVVLLSGSDTCFTSGNDVGDFLNPSGVAGATFIHTLPLVEKPMIAAVAGPAVGVGTTMLLHCDLVYASSDAYLKLPFVDLALVPEAASSLLLPRIIGHQRASQLLLMGERLGAETAREWGLVNEVVPPGQVLAHAREKAKLLAQRAPAAVQATKRLLRRAEVGQVSETMRAELEEFGARLRAPEAREAMQAFLQKRAPRF